jgi:hypothetical protein
MHRFPLAILNQTIQNRTRERKLTVEDHRRDRTRTNYSADALVKSGKIGAIKGRLRDISIDALYLYINPLFEIDDHVKVEIILFGADSQLIMNVQAVVVRKDQNGIAMRFLNPFEWWPIFSLFPLQSLDSGHIRHKNKHPHDLWQIRS